MFWLREVKGIGFSYHPLKSTIVDEIVYKVIKILSLFLSGSLCLFFRFAKGLSYRVYWIEKVKKLPVIILQQENKT